jgi:two-component system, LytTR family, response regulator
MNKLKAVLVDDEPRGLSSLQKLLEYNCPVVEIAALCSSADEAKAVIADTQPQLVFLDISMPEKSGFDLLDEIGEPNFEIIFVTAYNDFMLQAFRFSCVDYLLKPVDDNQLVEAVNRAAKRIDGERSGSLETLLHNLKAPQSGQKLKICITSLKGFQVIKLSDIIYCEANRNYTSFHLENQKPIIASKTVYDYETLLEDSGFVRIHKSFLVNLEHVKEYNRGEGGTVVMSNNYELEVSRRRKELFLNKMREFYKF